MQMNLVKNFIFYSSSIALFFVSYFISFFLIVISKSNVAFAVSIYSILITVFLIRIIIRKRELREFLYFDIAEDKFKSDSCVRAMQFSDAAAVIIFAFAIISLNQNMFESFGNSILGISIFISVFYLVCGSLSISNSSQLFKFITILLSTLQGFTFILVLALLVCLLLNNLIQNVTGNLIDNSLSSLFGVNFLIEACYAVENSFSDILVIMIMSIILSLFLISLTPAYQLDDLSTAFKCVNVFSVLMGIIVYFYVNTKWLYIKGFINIQNFPDFMHDTNFSLYLSEFSKSNITNLAYVLLLPYSFSALLSSLVIECLKRRYSKKAKNYFSMLVHAKDNSGFDFLKKKYLYYCGDKDLLYIFELSHSSILI